MSSSQQTTSGSSCATTIGSGAFPSAKLLQLLVLLGAGTCILGIFWFTSRYPSLLQKASGLASYQPHSFVYTNVLMDEEKAVGLLDKMLAVFLNWCWSMRVGMTFGLSMGALLHTLFQLFPLRPTNSVYLNTIKGILVGAPAGVCVNCAVPVACGITRAKNKIETALGFMLSSPSLNIIVVSMILSAFPWQFAVVHFSLITIVLLVVLPTLVKFFHKEQPMAVMPLSVPDSAPVKFSLKEMVTMYFLNLWKLFKTAVPMMLLAGAFSAVAMQLIPFDKIFSEASFGKIVAASFITTLLPAPIAMETMVAHYLHTTGVHPSYVIIFLSTLGSFSILPMMYLWHEVSKKLAVGLYLSFVVLGVVAAYTLPLLI